MVEENPIMDYAKNIIFGYYGTLTVSVDGVSESNTYIYTYILSSQSISLYLSINLFQNPVTFATYESLESEYLADRVHPGDLKAAVTEAMNRLLVGNRL